MSTAAAPLPTIRRHQSGRRDTEAPRPIEVQQAEFLTAQGWVKTDVTFRRVSGSERVGNAAYEEITWWKKNGHEYPQHFAVWLERKGLV